MQLYLLITRPYSLQSLGQIMHYMLSVTPAIPSAVQDFVHDFLDSLWKTATQLGSCLINAQEFLEYVIFILWVCSFSKRLPSVTFAEENVLLFLILREKMLKWCNS